MIQPRGTVADVNNPDHVQLEADVAELLGELGYLTDSATYHTVMRKEVQDLLKFCNTPTGLYIRGRADRIAIHKHATLCFIWEAKTRRDSTYEDVLIEALPLAHHVRSGIRCLYVFRHCGRGLEYEGAFWTDNLPPINQIIIPTRWGDEYMDYFRSVFSGVFPTVPIQERQKTRGSDDPYVIILKKDRDQWFVEWKVYLRNFTDAALLRHGNEGTNGRRLDTNAV
jgi:hypothetical protein